MSDPWQTPGEIRDRLGDTYQPDSIYTDHNVEKRFHDLLEQLESEAREEIENRLGDEPIAAETGRVDTMRAPEAATLQLVYPVNDVTQVEARSSSNADWREIDAARWQATPTRVILLDRTMGRHRNDHRRHTDRQAWADFANEVRVTYDRGYDPVPGNLIRVQMDLIKRALRGLRSEQAISAADPEQMDAITQGDMVLTDDLRDRIDSVSMPTYKHSVV